MSLARRYNRVLKRHLLHYAAWEPVAEKYEPGDYGAFRKGVFRRLGNIREFGVDPAISDGNPIAFDFTSASTTIVRLTGDTTVDAFPGTDAQAKLQISFEGSRALYIRTSGLQTRRLDAVDAVAHTLRRAKAADGRKWKLGWRVIRTVYAAQNPAILASSKGDTQFLLSGTAKALAALEVGNGSAEIAVQASRQEAITVTHGSGPVALDLFRVRLLGGAGLEAAFGDTAQSDDDEDDDTPIEDDEFWPPDPEDDPDDLFG